MEYYLIPINETSFIFKGERLKDLLYEKYPDIGELEVKLTTKLFIKDKSDKKKEKIQNKSDNKKDKIFDKLNIPKYLIVYKYLDGLFYETETGEEVITKEENKLNKYVVKFEEAYDYFCNTNYYDKLMNFINKESTLDVVTTKEEVKTKKKTKNK